MNLNRSDWKFDSEVAPEFNDHVAQSVPLYEEMHSLIVKMSEWFLEDNTNMYDIGTSTAKVLKGIYKNSNKDVRYIGIDNSEDMLSEVGAMWRDKFELMVSDAQDIDIHNASYITSVLTLQFIPERDRQDIINNIYKGLNKGGAFVLVEKILGDTSQINNVWEGLYHDMKMENGLSKEHVIDKQRSIRGVMKPLTLNENNDMIREAGFKKQEEFFKWGNFVGIIAIK